MRTLDRASFYQETDRGLRCRLCGQRHGTHAASCPLVALHRQLQGLSKQLGLYVAEVREVYEGLEALVRGES